MTGPLQPRRPATAWSALRASLQTRLRGSGLGQLHIRWRFRIVVLAFGLPFLAYIVWSATQQAVLEKEHARDRARANATLVASRFEDHIEQIDRLLATIGESVGGRINHVGEIDQLLYSVRGYLPKPIDNIGVWSPTGDSIAALDQRSAARRVNVEDRAYFREAVERRDLAFEGPIRSRTTGISIIQFARPVIVKGEVVAVISMAIRTGQLIAQIDPDGQISDRSLVTIFNERGTVVSRSLEPELWVGKQIADVPALAAAFAARGGTREETSIDGRQRLAGYAVVGRWPWIVMVGEPIERVTGPISDRLLRNLGIGLVIFAVAMLVAGRVAAWTTTPLMQLADDTERFGHGDLSHRSPVTSGGEIATLAANFNRMAAAIEQRDLALATSRTQLKAITDNVPEQITYLDREERYRFVNEYTGPLAKVRPAEMIGRTIREVRGEELYRVIAPSFRRALTGERQSIEMSAMVDGRMAHFFVTYVPDIDDDGTVRGVYAFTHDITSRKTAELLLAESENRLLLITDNLPAMVCYVDRTRCFRFANRAFEKWLERPLDQVIGVPFDRLMPTDVVTKLDGYFVRCLRGETLEFEMQVPVRTDAGPRWLRCNFIPDVVAGGDVRGVYGMIHNVSKSKEAEERLTRLAQFDTLTGLANRNQFNETLARALDANDLDRQPLALMFLDIDHFKQVNDRHGHAGGDLLLKDFAARLTDCVRPTDAVARLSGDEFVVLLEGMHSDDEPQFIARKIIATVEKPFQLDDAVVQVTTSIGIAMRAHPHEPASTLMKRADEALYEAKRGGRNTFRLAS